MARFDRWDVMAAYNVFSQLYGWDAYTHGIQARLSRLKYRPGLSDQHLETLSPNAKAIFGRLVRKHAQHQTAYDRLHRRRPDVFPPWPGLVRVGSYDGYLRRLGLSPDALYTVA